MTWPFSYIRRRAPSTASRIWPVARSAKRPEWDQKKAIDIIKGLVTMEKNLAKTGNPWDKIAWLTDADEAIARAKKENKAIFVYCYCNDGKGPAAAPC